MVRLSRADVKVALPAHFLLVGAMNPCPCGLRSSPDSCRCSDGQLARYCRRVSGPLLDRFDLRIDVHARRPDRPVACAPGRMLGPGRRSCRHGSRARALARGSLQRRTCRVADLDLWAPLARRRVERARARAPRRKAERTWAAPGAAGGPHDRRSCRARWPPRRRRHSAPPSRCGPIRRSSSSGWPGDGPRHRAAYRSDAAIVLALATLPDIGPARGSTPCSTRAAPNGPGTVAADGRAHLGPAARVMGKEPANAGGPLGTRRSPRRFRPALATPRRRRGSRRLAGGRRLSRRCCGSIRTARRSSCGRAPSPRSTVHERAIVGTRDCTQAGSRLRRDARARVD